MRSQKQPQPQSPTRATTRFYIVPGDDRPVVRAVPVAARPVAPRPAPVPEAPAGAEPTGSGRTRVSRLVRAAVRRPRGR